MEKYIRNIINESRKRTIDTAELLQSAETYHSSGQFELKGGYVRFAEIVGKLCGEGVLVPVKNSGMLVRNPSLYNRYRISSGRGYPGNRHSGSGYPDSRHSGGRCGIASGHEAAVHEGNRGVILEELLSMHPLLKKDYYIKHAELLEADREHIKKLNVFLAGMKGQNSLKSRCTLNERSFEIFNDEKFLAERGEAFLRRLGLTFEDLNCYRTYEAFFYIILGKGAVNNVLIVENKDTFMSMVKMFQAKGTHAAFGSDSQAVFGSDSQTVFVPDSHAVFGPDAGVLVYGEGKKILSSFKFMEEISRDLNIYTVYYFGDIDYEGIEIFLSLRRKYPGYGIVPHTALYMALLDSVRVPPHVRSRQAITDISGFTSFFDDSYREKITGILVDGRYIPQEAVNFGRKIN